MPSRNRQNLQKLVRLLQTHPDGLTSEEIAAQLNVSRQTAYNNIRQLQDEGYDIQPHGSLWRLDIMSHHTLQLSLPEAWLLYMPLRRILRAELHRYPLVRDLLLKVTDLFREPEIAGHLVPPLSRQPEHNVSDNFSKLVECWREKKLAVITYRRLNAVQPVEMRVAPYWFEPAVWTDGFYVIAGVEQRGGDHFALTLKLERIQSVQPMAATFQPPSIEQLTARIAETWGIWQGEDAPVRITLRFHNRQYDRLRETRWHPSEKITLEPDGAVIWQGYVSEPQEMLPWIRSWGADVEVLEPDHIREQIASEAEQTARLYDIARKDDSRASRYF